MQDVGEQLRERGWRQGTIVPAGEILEAMPDGSPMMGHDYAMVVSQSCDLVHHDLGNEPTAMILLLKRVNSGNLEVMHGRNPRRIHFKSIHDEWFEAWAWNQTTLPRDKLATKYPSGEIGIDARVLRCILDWLAKRFTRIAFPDGFNRTLAPNSNAIGKLLKKHHQLFSEILMNISPFDELEADQRYELACYLLMEAKSYNDRSTLADARAIAAKLEKLFVDCRIEVLQCIPVSEEALTVAEFNHLLNWDYDHLTNRASTDS